MRYLVRSHMVEMPWGRRLCVIRDPYEGGDPVDTPGCYVPQRFPDDAKLAKGEGGLHYVESLTPEMTWERRDEGFEFSKRDGIPIQ